MTSRIVSASLAAAVTAVGMTAVGTATLAGSADAATTEPAKRTSPQVSLSTPVPAPAAPVTYTVTGGDSLSRIALAQGLDSWRPLWDANSSLTDPDMIYPGQILTVPQAPVAERPLPAGVSQTAPQAQVEAARPSYAPPRAATPVTAQPAPAAAVVMGNGATGDIFGRIRQRESGGNYAINTGNGYYGAYQFNQSTWRSNAPAGYENVRPDQAPPQVQDQAAQNLYARRGCSPWPNTCY